MSKKRLLLASAILSVATLAASCGGGGGGGVSATTTPPPSTTTTPTTTTPTAAFTLLVQAQGGFPLLGTTVKYYKVTVNTDGTYNVDQTDVGAAADADMEVLVQFGNGNTLYRDPSNNLWFYNGTSISAVKSGFLQLQAPGCTVVNANLALCNTAGAAGTTSLIKSDGSVQLNNVQRVGESSFFTYAGNTYLALADGTVKLIIQGVAIDSVVNPIPVPTASSGNLVIARAGNNVYLVNTTDGSCPLVNNATLCGQVNSAGAGIAAAGTTTIAYIVNYGGAIYTAYTGSAGTSVVYYKVQGNVPQILSTNGAAYNNATANTLFALDAQGRLAYKEVTNSSFAFVGTDGIIATSNVVGSSALRIVSIGNGFMYASAANAASFVPFAGSAGINITGIRADSALVACGTALAEGRVVAGNNYIVCLDSAGGRVGAFTMGVGAPTNSGFATALAANQFNIHDPARTDFWRRAFSGQILVDDSANVFLCGQNGCNRYGNIIVANARAAQLQESIQDRRRATIPGNQILVLDYNTDTVSSIAYNFVNPANARASNVKPDLSAVASVGVDSANTCVTGGNVIRIFTPDSPSTPKYTIKHSSICFYRILGWK